MSQEDRTTSEGHVGLAPLQTGRNHTGLRGRIEGRSWRPPEIVELMFEAVTGLL